MDDSADVCAAPEQGSETDDAAERAAPPSAECESPRDTGDGCEGVEAALAMAEEGAEEGAEGDAPSPRRPGPGARLSDEELQRDVFALLFASPEPLGLARLIQLLERPPAERVKAALLALEGRLEASELPLRVRGLRGGFTLVTSPEAADVVARLAQGKPVERVSPAALETLAIVAYRQPVTKAEVEAIRGVQAGPVLRALVDRGLVRVVGRADVPGHPLQYGTTKEFLDRFGLMGLGDLPRDAELARG